MASPFYEKPDVTAEGNGLLEVRGGQRASRSPSPFRRSNESPPTRSEYASSHQEAAAGGKLVLDAFKTKFRGNLRLLNAAGTCVYYVDNSSFTLGKPDVTLRTGDEKTGPVIGVCKWSGFNTKTVRFGLGDPESDEAGVVWDEMRSDSRFHIEYKWKFEQAGGSPKTFVWKRTKKDENMADHMRSQGFKLADEGTGEIVAMFGSNRWKSWKKLGKFTFMVDFGERWQLMVLLTGLALVEISRRRSRSSAAAGGGGGGGGA